MYHLIIAAWPESAAVIMVGQETEDVDAAEVYRDYAFLPQLIPAVKQAVEQFPEGSIPDCCVYGPADYIHHIADSIADEFENLKVTTEEAGA